MPATKKKTTKPMPPRFSARTRVEYQECVDVIIEARVKSGFSQTELAKELGVAQSWVGKAETGVRRIDFIELITIAEAIGVKPADLIVAIQKRLTGVRRSAAKKK